MCFSLLKGLLCGRIPLINPFDPLLAPHVCLPTPAQVVYASISTAVFFAVITLLEGHPQDVASVVQAKFMPTLAANYAIWPLAHISEWGQGLIRGLGGIVDFAAHLLASAVCAKFAHGEGPLRSLR